MTLSPNFRYDVSLVARYKNKVDSTNSGRNGQAATSARRVKVLKTSGELEKRSQSIA